LDPGPVIVVPSIFHTREVHIDEMNIKRTKTKNPFWRQRFGTYTIYLISKGNPSSAIGDGSIIVATCAQQAFFRNNFSEYFTGCQNSIGVLFWC
jgi:hypothetical protein